jgi:membrane peptidoglycan carboxypeptidase
MITDILSDVTRRGTARQANANFKKVAIAGKTGTSRDGWFVGYTPNLICAVWVGFDDNQQLGLTGAEAALPAWIEFMKEALEIRPSLGGSSFAKPGGIVTVTIDPETGELAGPNCPTSQTVRVAAQFAPMFECTRHLPALESEDEATDTQSPDRTDSSITEPDLLEPNSSEDSSDQSLPISNQRPGDPADEGRLPAAVPKMSRPETQTTVSPSGRTALINGPVVPNASPTPKGITTRRPQ